MYSEYTMYSEAGNSEISKAVHALEAQVSPARILVLLGKPSEAKYTNGLLNVLFFYMAEYLCQQVLLCVSLQKLRFQNHMLTIA